MMTYVVDQNMMRDEALVELIKAEPEATLVLPDVAFVEMSKHQDWEVTMARSLSRFKPAALQACLVVSVGEAMNIELTDRRCIQMAELFPNEFRGFVQSLVQEFGENREGPSRRLIRTRFGAVRAALLEEDLDAETRKGRVTNFVAKMERALNAGSKRQLRQKGGDESLRLQLVRGCAYTWCQNDLRARGFSDESAYAFSATKPMVLRYWLALVNHVVNWVIMGGVDNVSPQKELNSLLDMEYGVIATFFDGFLSKDGNAYKAFQDLKIMLQMS